MHEFEQGVLASAAQKTELLGETLTDQGRGEKLWR
jgi:hypothetical protein